MGIKMKVNTGTSNKHNLSILNKKKYIKNDLKVDNKSLFMDPIINLTSDQQAAKYQEMVDFCKALSKCLQCKKKTIDLEKFCSTPDGGIRGLCSDCLNYVTDDTQYSKSLVTWLNSVIGDYGMNFENGFPKLTQYEQKGKWCSDCQDYHVTIQTWDYR